MNTIDGGVEGMHKDWIHYVVPHAGSAQDRIGDAQLLKIKNCCGILVLASAKY